MSGDTECALCHKAGPVLRSHLIPKALYRMCRSERANPNPLAMGHERPQQTSRQAVVDLFCAECEQVLSANGERYVVGGCFRPDGSFPIRSTLLSATPAEVDGRDALYLGSKIPGLSLGPLVFFAISVLWRASVHAWAVPASSPLQNPLGRYEEEFRLFLLGHAKLPPYARLMLWVSSEADPPRMISFPEQRNHGGYHTHFFYIPGLHFILIVGRAFPQRLERAFRNDAREVPILVTNSRSEGMFSRVMREVVRRPREYRGLVARSKGAV